jgi:hypothetical protein
VVAGEEKGAKTGKEDWRELGVAAGEEEGVRRVWETGES